MADATVKVTVVYDFTGIAAGFRAAADAFDALQAHLSPADPIPAPAPVASAGFPEDNPPEDNPQEDPQGP
jgi:hypothetical protein